MSAYPGTGYPTRRGMEKGIGFTVNVPLPRSGSPYSEAGDQDLLDALSLLPEHLDKKAFTPDFILISAGFDGLYNDYIGNFSFSEELFYYATNQIMAIADQFCAGRIVSVLEGGYNPESLATAVDYHLHALCRLQKSLLT